MNGIRKKAAKVQYPLHLERWLHKAIGDAACRNGRSWNREANRRLEKSLQADSLVKLAQKRINFWAGLVTADEHDDEAERIFEALNQVAVDTTALGRVGKGSNLTPEEVDDNFQDMDERVNMVDGARKTMTVEEAAIELGISRNSAYEAVKRGEIPVLKIGRRLLVPRSAFVRMIAEDST